MVAANLEAKRRLSQPRSWRLPLCIPYSDIKLEMDTISDGSWGLLGAGACLCYLVQRYRWKNEDRVSIYLYGGQVGLNPMLKPHQQLKSEGAVFSLAQKTTAAALETLEDFNVAPAPDSPVILRRGSLCAQNQLSPSP